MAPSTRWAWQAVLVVRQRVFGSEPLLALATGPQSAQSGTAVFGRNRNDHFEADDAVKRT
jgi:hypothetical protein